MDEAVQDILDEQRNTTADVLSGLDSDPSKAARAYQLGRATGVDPALIYSDVEGFERQHKARLTSELLKNNKYLRSYVNETPMAAEISADDWGALDKFSQQLLRTTGALKSSALMLGKAAEGFKEGYGEGPLGLRLVTSTPEQVEYALSHPLTAANWGAALAIPDLFMRLLAGGVTGVAGGASEFFRQVGLPDLSKGAEHLGQAVLDPGLMASLGIPIPDLVGRRNVLRQAVNELRAENMRDAFKAASPFIDAGVEPPLGVHPLIDKIKIEQAKADAKAFAELEKESADVLTGEQSPEHLAAFIRLHPDLEVGIPIDAIRKLYGDKQLLPDDDILGNIPGILAQARIADKTGGDVTVHLANWFAFVDPEIRKELKDDIRHRQGGVTLEESKGLGQAVSEAQSIDRPITDAVPSRDGEAINAIREQASLRPLFEEGPAKRLVLKKSAEYHHPLQGNRHEFVMNDEKGRRVGDINVRDQGKGLYIDWIGGSANAIGPNGEITNIFGPRLIIDLFTQLAKEFPEADIAYGRRVSGAREKAGKEGLVSIKLDQFRNRAVREDADVPKGWQEAGGINPEEVDSWIKHFRDEGRWEKVSQETWADVKPSEEWTAKEREINDAVNKVLDRLVGPSAQREQAQRIVNEKDKSQPQGIYVEYSNQRPLIAWAVAGREFHGGEAGVVKVARHEALHHLRRSGRLREEEWEVLTKAAEEEDWLGKHNIEKRYPNLSRVLQLEEAIAEEVGVSGRPEPTTAVGKILQKIRDALAGIKDAIKSILGREPTVEDIFGQIERGEVGKRKADPIHPDVFREAESRQGELDVTRMEDKPIAEPKAFGHLVDQYRRYQEKIKEQRAKDQEYQLQKITKALKKRQTQEWVANEIRIRNEVQDDFAQDPATAALIFFGEGILGGEKRSKVRLDQKKLTKEQIAALPKEFYGKGGLEPDAAAGMFGYQSGAALIEQLAKFEKDKGELSTKAYLRRLINDETERRMQKEYGELGMNILKEAQEHVLSDTQLDLLHEETLFLAAKAGTEFTLTKDQMVRQAKIEFGELPHATVSVENSLNEAGKAGRLVELALLEDNPAEAFRQSQRKQWATIRAKEAKKLEKEKEQFERLVKKYDERELKGVDPAYTNFVHQILLDIGLPLKGRSVQDLAVEIKASGFKDLDSFVLNKQQNLRPVDVADFLLDPTYDTKFDKMSVDEFRAVMESIQILDKIGRDELKVERQGETADFIVKKAQMIEQLELLKKVKDDLTQPARKGYKYAMKMVIPSLLQMEAIFLRWDRGNPDGVFTKYIALPLAEAANHAAALERKYSLKLKSLADGVDLRERVENNLFLNPDDGTPIPFTRKSLRAVLQNVGNEGNFERLIKGFGGKDENGKPVSLNPEKVMDWLHKNATKKDWEWAQKQGQIYAELKAEVDVMYRNLTGVAPESVETRPVQIPSGSLAYPAGETLDGWYHPVQYSSRWERANMPELGRDVLQGENYVPAITTPGRLKKRTAPAGPLSLDLDENAQTMRQVIHDLAYRPAVLQASKFFRDKEIQQAVRLHYGIQYRDMLIPYLRDIVNHNNFPSAMESWGASISEGIRQNIIASLIGFNPGTVLKHFHTAAINSLTEVGGLNFLREIKTLFSTNEAIGESNWNFAMKGGGMILPNGEVWRGSEELQRRHRNYTETLGGAQERILGEQSWRDFATRVGATPVAWSDLLSAVPTWLAKYKEEMAEGAGHGKAVAEADRAVRRAHGSTAITNRPAAMRGGALASWVTSLYGFFSHMLNRQFEMAWRARDVMGAVREGDWETVQEHLPHITKGIFSYIILPALIEELVTPLTNDEKESWAHWSAVGLIKGTSSSWPVVRELVDFALSYGRKEPSVGLLSAAAKAATDLIRDVPKGKEMFSKQQMGNTIQHAFSILGVGTGLVNAQEGKVAKFIYNYANGLERPKGPWQWLTGLRYGQTKGHSETLKERVTGRR